MSATAVYGPKEASCRIYTFKEGVLAGVGHDLVLELTRFEVRVFPDRIEGSFDATSIRTICARKGKVDQPHVLSASQLEQIDENTRGTVLAVGQFPRIEYVTTQIDRDDDEVWSVSGQLSLHGLRRAVSGEATLRGEKRVGLFWLTQPDFGIKPYSALMGTLRVQARVQVEITLPR